MFGSRSGGFRRRTPFLDSEKSVVAGMLWLAPLSVSRDFVADELPRHLPDPLTGLVFM